MNQRLAILLLPSLMFMTACDSGGGSSGKAVSKDEVIKQSSAQDYSVWIRPNNFTVVKANMTYEEQAERYTLGCKTPGQASYSSEVDRQLTVGQVFKQQRAGHKILDDAFQISEESTVTMVAENQIHFDVIYDKFSVAGLPFQDISQIFSKTPHMKTEVQFSTDANGNNTDRSSTTEMNLTTAALEYLKQKGTSGSSSYIDCEVDYKNAQPTYENSTSKIMYNLNGLNVVGYLTKSSQSGQIVCEERVSVEKGEDKVVRSVVMGKGKSEYITISSNDIVSSGRMECGGTEIFRSSRLVLDDGRLLENYYEKTLVAPER